MSGDRKLFLQVSGPMADNQRADAAATTALLRELSTGAGLGVDRLVESTGGPAGRKAGEVVSLAELAITGAFSATTLAALTRIVVAFVRRGAARRIVLRDGDRTLTIVDPSERTERAVARWLGATEPPGPNPTAHLPDTVPVPQARRGVGSGVD
ncbi:hypothetical protein OG792_04790 [Micromonospora sp. NBC_01699]|uniref:hypothetical protein n=1 Tax=Micromonospora sp. NBC_01699 TaxID=2975984 RepID=UPI002E36FD1F|nr:hypothetical protein [Micromonospora sp. NBC_01699]